MMFNDMMHQVYQDENETVKIIENNPHSELIEIAAISAVAGTTLLADDLTLGGVAGDPLAAACFFVSEVAETAFIVVTTVDVFKNLYSTLSLKPHSQHETNRNWDKHSGRRAGKRYNINQNNKKGEKNRTYKTPPNPNKKPKSHKKK